MHHESRHTGQITLFLLVVIVLIGTIIIIGNLENQNNDLGLEAPTEISLDSAPLKTWLDACIAKAAAESAYKFGMQQGFFAAGKNVLSTSEANISYYVSRERNTMPSNDFFENELSRIMDVTLLQRCSNQSFFEEQGYHIYNKNPKTEAAILEDHVLFEIEYPITIATKSTNTVSRFSYDLPYRVGHVINVSRVLVQSVLDDPLTIDATLAAEQDLAIIISRYDTCNHIYLIIDNESRVPITDAPYAHTFAIGYSDSYCNFEHKDP